MNDEILIEEGIVISSQNGFAEISLTKSEYCEDCGAKIICKPQSNSNQTLKVIDPYGALPGDIVKISIKGKALVKTSIVLYGIPLFILIIVIFLANLFWGDIKYSNLYSFLASVSFTIIYYLIIFFFKISQQTPILPEIISLYRK
jgi:positive regulator of sigma E activity